MAELRSKIWIEEHRMELPEWQRTAFGEFAAMIAGPENKYPCVPGHLGYITNNLRYGFAPDPRSAQAVSDTAELLNAYGSCSRETGKYASLVIFFETPEDLKNHADILEYETLFWSLLNRLHDKDKAPWPDDIPQDPAKPTWEFCFAGQPYFAFCATPAHGPRRSRHFSSFLVAFQPRWIFDEINETTAFGRNISKMIRQKLADYDDVPVHASLKWYGQPDNQEWKQYFLRDDESSPSRCPFMAMKNKLQKNAPS
ncbi:YqcI/YcgG family protein [Paenibacillus chitinolyticus]|uniref:YqcI/YcgG family protein n=1 Tax=Paenibacillus chitinolyticus TaxID=79263 RepID=UPI00386D8C7F